MTDETTLRLLVIDDEQGDFEMARAMIANIDGRGVEYEVDWVPTFEEGLDAFARNEHDVYFVDYFLGDRDGLDLVREARERGIKKPVIMLTGRGSHEVDLEAMKAGASDYLVKGRIDPDVLERSIRYAMERVRAQAELRASEERHRGMFDHLPIGLYRVSVEGDFMDANPALVRILDFPDPETLRERYAANLYVSPDDRKPFAEMLEEYGLARGFESTLQLEDGSTVRVRNTARAHRDPDGRIRYFEGAVEDVSEERSAQEIRGSAERFDTVYRHSNLCVVLVDLDGNVLQANPAFLRSFAYALHEVTGVPLVSIASDTDRATMERDLWNLGRGATDQVTGERRLRGGDGAHLWARTRASLVRNGSGEPDHVMLMLEDVAESTD